MKLILVRHGESAKNVGLDVLGGDNNLTLKGVHQAIAVGKKLVEQKIDTIYCSPSERCVQTMDEILRLREDNFPIHLTKLVGPKTSKEQYEKMKARVELFLDDLKYEHQENETVVVISHQLVLAMMILQLTGETRRMENGEMEEIEITLSS